MLRRHHSYSESDVDPVIVEPESEEQPGFWANMHEWPTWKWVLFGVGVLVLLSAVIFGSIVTFGGAGVAIMAAAGGAGFATAMSVAWAACASVLTNVAVMTILAGTALFLETCLLFVLKNDKPLTPVTPSKITPPHDKMASESHDKELSGAAKLHKQVGPDIATAPTLDDQAKVEPRTKPKLVIDTSNLSHTPITLHEEYSPRSPRR